MQGAVLFPPRPARGLDKVPLPPVVLMSFPSNPCQQCSQTSEFCSKQTGDKWCLTVTSLSLSQVQQSSFYGYTGMLPKRYTQGVMTGESEYLQTPGAGRRAAWALGPSSWDRGGAQEPWVCGAGDRLAGGGPDSQTGGMGL